MVIILLLILWALFVFSAKVNSTMLMTLTPLLFGFIVVFFLLPQLSKLKLAGLEAEVEKMTPEPLEGPKGLRLEPGGALTPSSNIAPEPGRERVEGRAAKLEY